MTRAILLRAAGRATPRLLWRDRDLLGPILGAAVVAHMLLELARRLRR